MGKIVIGICTVLTLFFMGYYYRDSLLPIGDEQTTFDICKNIDEIIIFSQYGDNDQRGITIRKRLNTEGCKVRGPIKPKPKDFSNTNEIRYFYKSDRKIASAIANYLKDTVGSIEPVLTDEFSHNAPETYMEIWIDNSELTRQINSGN